MLSNFLVHANILLLVAICYYVFINMTGFIAMGIDKRRAIKKLWRTKESTLFMISIVGGALGSITGMKLFRHKTQKLKFRIIFGMSLIVHIIFICYLFYKGIL